LDIVITGSVAIDYLMRFPGYFRDHILPDKLDQISLSFLVESMVVHRGGIAPNIAYTLALLGGKPRLMATVGEDFADYRAWLESQGVDTRLAEVIPGVFTASFFANTDRGNAQIASFYPGAMAHAAQLSFTKLNGPAPELVIISPNDPGAMIQYVDECNQLGIPYFYDPSQQIVRLDATALRRGVEMSRALFVNDYEFGLVQKTTGMTPADILAHTDFFVVTRGEEGADIYTDEQEIHVPIFPAEQIADPTGVGDAFRGGFLAGYSHGWDLKLCGEMGALAATYCLENQGTQAHQYTPAAFAERFRQRFDDDGKLDSLAAGK
jgi:adenosine kinase